MQLLQLFSTVVTSHKIELFPYVDTSHFHLHLLASLSCISWHCPVTFPIPYFFTNPPLLVLCFYSCDNAYHKQQVSFCLICIKTTLLSRPDKHGLIQFDIRTDLL